MKPNLCLLVVVLAGCAAPGPSPYIHLVQETPPPAATKPWSDGQVATYWIGRTTTRPDGNVMHETHPLYRLEGAGQPQLATPLGSYYPSDPAPSCTNATYEQYESLRAEAARARDYTVKLAHAAESLVDQSAQLRRDAETNHILQARCEQIIQSATTLSNRVMELEQRLTPPARPAKP
jgi:hypothetical protein